MTRATTSPSLHTPSPFASWKIEHAGIRVPDFDAAVAWYTEKLDFRVTHNWLQGDKTFGFISPAADDRFSFELVAGPGAANRPAFSDLGTSLKLSGWHHRCFRVDSVHDTIAELKRRGVTIVSEPRDVVEIGRRFAFFTDPWGNLFEVIQAISNQT
jgi:catechol 2,3-dioxygenase-like lactoylglutathione lyase family enzyme